MKPGIRSTEWWLTLAVVALTAILGSGLIEDMPEMIRIVSLILTVLGALGYTVARAFAKKGRSDPPRLLVRGETARALPGKDHLADMTDAVNWLKANHETFENVVPGGVEEEAESNDGT